VLCEEQNHIATLTLNRPEKHNAMSPDMLVAMREHIRRLETAGTTRVLIIRGQGISPSAMTLAVCPKRQDAALTQGDEPMCSRN
jgi:1,4-dihydroxy-2-naphthoyl-CoA synthase